MIELNTGIPGSGKSLSNVQRLADLISRWGKHPEEARPVFVYNIPDLLLPHSEVPLKQYQVNSKVPVQWVVDWDAMPDNSLVLIDECAKLFPPRSSASAMPPYIEFLTIHRKRGFDIWFTTQNPKFVDHGLRALVGKHLHFRRIFGMQRSIIYEWDSCSDSCSGYQNAVKSHFSFPKNIFKLYKSAEIHTKQNFKLPAWLLLPLVSLALGVYFVPRAYAVLSGAASGKGVGISSPEDLSISAPPESLPASTVQPLFTMNNLPPPGAGHLQAVDGALPVYEEQVIPDKLLIAACIASATRCRCYNSQSVPLKLSDQDCRAGAEQVSDRFRLKENEYETARL